jgi:hypothetical protein
MNENKKNTLIHTHTQIITHNIKQQPSENYLQQHKQQKLIVLFHSLQTTKILFQ